MELIVASLLLIALIVSFALAWLCGVYLFYHWWALPRRFSLRHQCAWLHLWRWGWIGLLQGIVLLFAYGDEEAPWEASFSWLGFVGMFLVVASPYVWIHAANVYRRERDGKTPPA